MCIFGTVPDRMETWTKKWHRLLHATVTESNSLRHDKNNVEMDGHLESVENCIICKVVGCGLLSMY